MVTYFDPVKATGAALATVVALLISGCGVGEAGAAGDTAAPWLGGPRSLRPKSVSALPERCQLRLIGPRRAQMLGRSAIRAQFASDNPLVTQHGALRRLPRGS